MWVHRKVPPDIAFLPEEGVLQIGGKPQAHKMTLGRKGASPPGSRTWVQSPTEGFPGGSAGRGSTCSVGELDSAWGWEDPLEKGMATHSSILAWRIPQTVKSMGSQRVGHDWATFTFSCLPKGWLGGQRLLCLCTSVLLGRAELIQAGRALDHQVTRAILGYSLGAARDACGTL